MKFGITLCDFPSAGILPLPVSVTPGLLRQRLQSASDADLQLYLLQLVQAGPNAPEPLCPCAVCFSTVLLMSQALRYEPLEAMESEAFHVAKLL